MQSLISIIRHNLSVFCTFSNFLPKILKDLTEILHETLLGDKHLIDEDSVCGMQNWT